MIGAGPKFQSYDRMGAPGAPAVARPAPRQARQPRGPSHRAGSRRWRWITLLSFVPLSLALVQCGQAPGPGTLAANVPAPNPKNSGDSFDDRFPQPQFRDRFPSASESFQQRQVADLAPKRTAPTTVAQATGQGALRGSAQTLTASDTAPYRVASLEPQLPYQRPPRQEDLTTLVSMKSSAFPYFGNNPASDAPFLNISKGDRRGHRSYSGRVYWQDETYSDNRVLVHVPETFDIRTPGVIVGFFPGN